MNVALELQLANIEYVTTATGEYRVVCPFHADTTPSCDIRPDDGRFVCRSCKASGMLARLLARRSDKSVTAMIEYLDDKYGSAQEKPIDPATVERWHKKLCLAPALVNELKKRHVFENEIRTYRLGEDRGRVTIPITNVSGLYVNTRRYAPGSTDGAKMTNMRGRSRLRLFPVNQFKYDDIVIVGGEIKAIAAAAVLNPFGIGAVSVTGGEGEWRREFDDHFTDRKVWLCFDVDQAGHRAARKLATRLCRIASWLGVVDLPLDKRRFATGDVNDFLHLGGDLHALLLKTPEYEPPGLLEVERAEAKPASIFAVMAKDAVNQRFKLRTLVSAADQDMYYVPAEVKVKCDRAQDNCGLCPISGCRDAEPVVAIDNESAELLAMMDATAKAQREEIRGALKIPECKSVTFEPTKHYRLVDARVQRELALMAIESDKLLVPTVFVDDNPELNTTYEIECKTVAHPRTQRATLIVSKATTVEDALQCFELGEPDDVMRFHVEPEDDRDEVLTEKLNHIYSDYEANVTNIYQRRDLHAAIDLTYHSVIALPSRKGPVKGWVETLILGDSAQGKTETAMSFARHFGLGEKVESKNATVAGLLGGLEQIGGKWFVTWGAMPANDRQLVLMEELKGMPVEVFSTITDMRSSGVAQINKIQTRKASARCRIVALSNPRGSRTMSSYSYGIDAIRELIPNLEDIRRFDLALVLDKNEVNDVYEAHIEHEHVYDSLCSRRLVLWAWTRSHEHIHVTEAASVELIERTRLLCEKYTDDIPLLDRGSTRAKILKLAVALACRVFSTRDNVNVIVTNSHVRWVSDFIDRVYSTAAHGYADYSSRIKNESRISAPDEVKKAVRATPHARVVVERMLSTSKIDVQDLSDWTSWDRVIASEFMSLLVRANCLTRAGRSYFKTSQFIELLRELRSEEFAEVSSTLPNFMKGDF